MNGPPGPSGGPGATGGNGNDGGTGQQGDPGDTPSATTGTIAGSVTATTGGAPLANVTITGVPGVTSKTGADGTFSLASVPVGSYSLTFTKTGYADRTVSGVAVTPNGATHVALTMDTNPGVGGPTIVLADNLLAGYGNPVTLQATVTPSPDEDAAALTYSWTQTGGPWQAVLSGATTNALTFTTLKLSDAKPNLHGRFGPLGLSNDDVGNYTFTLTVTDPQGHATKASATVKATAPSAGLANVPVGIPAWFQGDSFAADGKTPQTSWNWTLGKSGAVGSVATLSGATTQFPSFTPDRSGVFTLTETISGKSSNVYAGTWVGVMDTSAGPPSCLDCHNDQTLFNGTPIPDKFTPWKNTAHYSALHRKLDGQASSHFGPSCMECHTVGDSPLAQNGGWDDVAAQANYSFPATLASGNWNDLVTKYPQVGQLGSIQCENCHGPQNSGAHPTNVAARVSYAADVCASCHQEAPTHYFPSQWQTSAHSSVDLALLEATVEGRGTTAAHCGRCHSAQGYARYSKQLLGGYTGVLTKDGLPPSATNAADVAWLTSIGLNAAEVQPQTCAACHDPHKNPNPVQSIDCSTQANYANGACAQLRLYDTISALPNGLTNITAVGTGAVCMSCHNTRNGEHTDQFPPTDYTAPHTPSQTDTLYGFNAYFVPRYTASPHLAVKNVCAGCHVNTPTSAQNAAHQTVNHSFNADLSICASCHGTTGVDGAALQSAMQTKLDALAGLLGTKVLSAVTSAITANGSVYVRAWDPATDLYSSTSSSSSNVPLTAAPTAIAVEEVHGQVGFVFTTAAPVSFTWSNGASASTTQIHLQSSSLKTGSSLANVYPANSVLQKAAWNFFLLTGDGTKGIHNLPFYQSVIDTTNAQLAALP